MGGDGNGFAILQRLIEQICLAYRARFVKVAGCGSFAQRSLELKAVGLWVFQD